LIFIDTSFFVALLSPRDTHHVRARGAFESHEGRRLADLFLTTNATALSIV